MKTNIIIILLNYQHMIADWTCIRREITFFFSRNFGSNSKRSSESSVEGDTNGDNSIPTKWKTIRPKIKSELSHWDGNASSFELSPDNSQLT